MWGLELPYRRYSVPETVMRKFRLRQSSSSSSDSSSRRVSRRPVARVRHAGRNRYCSNTLSKGVQTSPHTNQLTGDHPKEKCLLHSRHHTQPHRSSSVPDLSSDAEGRDNHRPSSASDKLVASCRKHMCNRPPVMITSVGTPSPSQPSNYSSALHRCDIFSSSWSYTTSSEYTLGQTVSDRTTSTQDSTLSIQSSTTPESASSNSFSSDRTAQKMFLENSIFSPAGNFIAVHTESLLIQPIEIIERRENWNFGLSDSPESDNLVVLPGYLRSIAINTEPPETFGVPMVDKSTCAYGMFNDKSAQVRDSDIENELMIDKSTYIETLNGLAKNSSEEESRTKDSKDQEVEISSHKDVGINTEHEETGVVFKENQYSDWDNKTTSEKLADNLSSKRAVFKIPHIKIFKGSTTESQMTDDRSNVIEEAKVYVTKSTAVDENLLRNTIDDQTEVKFCKYCHKEAALGKKNALNEGTKHIWKKKPEVNFQIPYERRLCADVACAGCNYKDYPSADGVIARFSAVPRSNSMLVNTSSIDYSSDSDLSLTDSLEDGTDRQRGESYHRSESRHDSRLVRGEVSLEQQLNVGKKYPKSNKAYAYFLSITGEQDMVRHCPLPDWLKVRLQRREEEIKKLFQVKLNKHQTLVYRKRKKTLKRIEENEDSNSTGNKEHDKVKKIQPSSAKFNERVNKGKKCTEVHINEEKVPSTSTAKTNDVINKEPLDVDNIANSKEQTSAETSTNRTQNSELVQQENCSKDNYVHISEVIKIEMLNSLNTVITKEKQINLNQKALTRDRNFQTSEFIKNESTLNTQKIIMKTNIGNFQVDNNNTMTELHNDSDSLSSKEKDKETKQIGNKNNVKAILKKNEKESYSFKQFQPLFQSKADDQTVAQILLSAMEKDTSLKTDSEFKLNEVEATQGEEVPPMFGKNLGEEHKTTLERMLKEQKNKLAETFIQPNIKIERSCNTLTPYLSAFVQTDKSFLRDKNISEKDEKKDDDETIEDSFPSAFIKNEVLLAENPLTSSSVQTTETFLENDNFFIESESLVMSRDQGTDVFEESSNNVFEESSNSTNEYSHNITVRPESEIVSVFVQTEQNTATINEVKPLIIHNKSEELKGVIQHEERGNKNYTSNKKPSTNADQGKRPKHYCKNEPSGSHEHKSSQVLELNVQPCTCHMCTLNKKTSSRVEKHSELHHHAPHSRRKLQSRSTSGDHKEEKKSYQKYLGNKRATNITNKFQRRFEVIPEEKNSSAESISEVKITPLQIPSEKNKFIERDNYEKETLDKDDFEETHLIESKKDLLKAGNVRSCMSILKERENVMYNSQVKGTQTNGSKKSNMVFGRFKAIKNDTRIGNDTNLLSEGIEIMQQYKGRAALASAPVDGQEQLLTLSKGWINFYLLKDNQECSDSNNDEVHQFHNEGFVQRGVSPIRILKGTEVKEEQIEEFTVEIRATPEPFQHQNDKTVLLPNLHSQETIKKHKSMKPQTQNNIVSLPEIQTSSSSSTPENLGERIVPVESKNKKCHPLPVVSGRRKSSRHEIRMKRESVTAFEKIPKPEPLLRLPDEFTSGFEKGHSAKAVEMALSEHSVSSITSSTLILSESPSPKPERKSRHRQPDSQNDRNGSSWTVTVAGTSGNLNYSPPDVEMRLTFGNKQTGSTNKEILDENEKRLVHFNAKKPSNSASTSKRKGRMIEEYAHSSRNERQSLHYLPGMVMQSSQNSKAELSHSLSHKELSGYLDQDNTSQLSRRSKGSLEGSSDVTSLCSDLQVTGLAITPESKPYVPTQSERDLVRRQRYKFTR